MIKKIFILSLFLFCISCNDMKEELTKKQYNEFFYKAFKKLTHTIVYDIFSPPVAARVYVYPYIAAFEAIRNKDDRYRSLKGQLKNLEHVSSPQEGLIYNFELSSLIAFLKVGKQLIFSESLLEEIKEEIVSVFKKTLSDEVYSRSIAFGQQIGEDILNWADTDMYKQTRSFPKHPVLDLPYTWQPTPPDYMDGIEPHWNKIRPMVIDSANQFPSEPLYPLSMDKNSEFYQEILEVYQIVKESSAEQKAIASFWDCNPYVSHHYGHVMFATKKITPGAHWMLISSIATKNKDFDLLETIACQTMTAITIFDAFIICWDEKYKSNLIRPETLINQYIDKDWIPVLQTPPFPEYTSGHSVISSSASHILTQLIGENFSFVDSSEVDYGLPPRKFPSFTKAAEEAAISRIYGGIHYRKAVEEGFKQGTQMAKFIHQKIKLYKNTTAMRIKGEQ